MQARWSRILFLVLVCAVFGTGSGGAFASSTDLDYILFAGGAFATSKPEFNQETDKATLSYLGDLNCNTETDPQNCHKYSFVCRFETPGSIELDFIGTGVSYVPFARMVKHSTRYPFVAYTDRLVRAYKRRFESGISFDARRARSQVDFTFVRARRIGDFDAGSYSMHWLTSDEQNADKLLDMFSSSELLLLAIPESDTSTTFYHKLPASPAGDDHKVAQEFASTFRSRWEEQR